ncbi:hypothetical protein PIB30_051305 [Stylosanthes scabra]|uniref:Putative plant transposon protein domain-containing protein n=1 Tax=Stylosanthes scabra TaxID=79078 RepID=A0ABU6ZGP5_9FABA|nr:hypothetical protein [Stylosanthes scabra]
MANLLKKRKGKAVAQSSSEVPRFKTPFHEAHFKGKLSARKVLPELIIEVNDEILLPCATQIKMRKWEKFTNPIQAVGHNMVKEFYANAWEPDKDKRKSYTYTTMVRGKDINFAPSDIKRVLKLRKDPLRNVGSYHERKANKDFRIEEVQECLCLEGGEWVRYRDGRHHYLKRIDLDPITKGWYDFVCRSILPTTNRSEVTVERAMLIHSIIIGENINVEEIIADQIYKFVYKTDLSSSLPFPGIIAALCLEAKVVTHKDDTLIPQELPIVGEAMVRVREPKAKTPKAKQTRQEAPQQQQQPPQEQSQPQVQQQDFPFNFYTHFDNSMLMIYRKLDSQQEESRKIFEALNTRMNRQKEEEMRQERMRHDQILQDAAVEKAKEENRGKARMVEEEEDEDTDELASSASEEW